MGVTGADGLSWTALPPPAVIFSTTSALPGQPSGSVEVGGVAHIHYANTSKYFLLVCSGWSMWMLVADRPTGPFRAASKNYRVLDGAGYFARFFKGCDGSQLVSHQAFGYPNHFVAPYKRADVGDAGVLRLKCWAGNDVLAGKQLRAKIEQGTLDLGRGVFLNGSIDLEGVANATSAGAAAKLCLPGFD